VPRLRKQAFETAIIERYRRRDISIEEAIVQMYLAGVSVRRVEDVTEALWGTRVSSGTVSNLNKKVYKHIERWRTQPIEGSFAYVYLDGIVLKRNIEEFPALIEVLHMPISGLVILVIQAVFTPVKFKWFKPELVAQFNVKGRGGFNTAIIP